MIDPTDVGAVAATTLTAGGHAGRTLRLSGPQALTPTDQLELLATALDRPLRLEALSDNEARGAIPEGYADVLLEIFRSQPALESEVQPTVEQVLGRPPRPLTDWIEPTGKPSCELAEYRAADSHPAAPWQLVGRIRARPHRLRGLATDRADGSLNQPQDRDERARDMYAPGPDHGDKRAVACRGGRL